MLTPAPARTISDSFLPAAMVAAVTFVDRTTSTCASPIAAGKSSADRSGFDLQCGPQISQCLLQFCEDSLSAISTFMAHLAEYRKLETCVSTDPAAEVHCRSLSASAAIG